MLALEAWGTDAPSTDGPTSKWRPNVKVADLPALTALRVSLTVVGVERALGSSVGARWYSGARLRKSSSMRRNCI